MDAADSPVIWIPGGVRGLGLACARELAARGARVWIHYRNSQRAAAALEREFDGRLTSGDLLEPGCAERALARVLARDARLDGLVHAVGDYASGPLAELTPAGLRALWDSNVASACAAVGAALPALRAQRGRVVCFGCAGASAPRAWRSAAAYAAAKSALGVLVRSWAVEEAPQGVGFYLVSPGFVPHADAHAETLDPQAWARIPWGRPGTPEELAKAVAWLLSPEAGYATGSELLLSGGWML